MAATLLAFVILLSIFFDAMGTMVGLANEAGTVDKDGNIPNVDRVLQVDALGAIVGGGASVSSNQIYVESGAGIGEGARTGLASIVTGLLFLVAMFFTPLINLVPFEAVAPALVVVGFMMVSQVGKIDWQDWGIAIPAFLTFTLMPFTYSIANGLGAGFISYVLIRTVPGPRPGSPPAHVGSGRRVPAVLRHRSHRAGPRRPVARLCGAHFQQACPGVPGFSTDGGGGWFSGPCCGELGAWIHPPLPSISRRRLDGPFRRRRRRTPPLVAGGGTPYRTRACRAPARTPTDSCPAGRPSRRHPGFLQRRGRPPQQGAGGRRRGARRHPRGPRARWRSTSTAHVFDAGDVTVRDGALEAGQARAGVAVAALLDAGNLTVVLGGGHETAFASYLGVAGSEAVRGGKRLGVLNLDAHFDLRDEPTPSLRHAVPADGPGGRGRGTRTEVRRRRDLRAQQHPGPVQHRRHGWA